MPGKKKITEALRKEIINRLKRKQMPSHIAKDLGLHRLTVAAIGRKAGVWKSPNKAKPKAAPQPTRATAFSYSSWINYGLDKGWLRVRIDELRKVQVELA